jgi:hypothetical protein
MKNKDEEIFIRGYWSIASMMTRTCIAARREVKLRSSSASMKTATTLGYYTVCLNATLPWSEPALHTTRVRRPHEKSQRTTSKSERPLASFFSIPCFSGSVLSKDHGHVRCEVVLT